MPAVMSYVTLSQNSPEVFLYIMWFYSLLLTWLNCVQFLTTDHFDLKICCHLELIQTRSTA